MADKHNNLDAMRHSLAHILAAAVQQLWPKAKFGVGPVIDDGFYYDIDIDKALKPEDLPKIEAEMNKIIKANLPFRQFNKDIDAAIKFVKAEGQTYKVDLLQDLKKYGSTKSVGVGSSELGLGEKVDKITTVSFYQTGDFTDLCRGPHVAKTGDVGAFKLTHVSGAYWRGDQSKAQLQRIYGLGFATNKELDDYLMRLAEAEKRDHRKLGSQLDIFMHSEVVGAGLPLFTPKGTAMINAMMDYVREINEADDYQEVRTGHVTREELYAKSGHLEKFDDDLFVVEAGEDKLALKPMNCPHHIQLFARDLRSYRDLPIKYAEFSTLHRNEVKGALGGLTRVRSLTQDDAHAFVRPDQVEAEIGVILGQVDKLMGTYGLTYWVRLSLRDKANMVAYLGDGKVWDRAEKTLLELAKKFKMDYRVAEGEAAFYGPKMDFMATDAIGREWQVSTIQLDFQQPERFDLSYVDEKGKKVRPVMIHRALNGTFERMLGVLIEHYAGAFPTWLAPEQVRIATVNDSKKLIDFGAELAKELRTADLRVELDAAGESVGKKIRDAELKKVPYTLVVGEKERKSGKVTPRVRGRKEDAKAMTIAKFAESVTKEAATRAPKPSL